MSNFKSLVDKSRSHREFEAGITIPRDAIVSWLSNANHCPAAMNMQTLKYVIVDSADEVSRMLGITRWATNLDKKLPPVNHGPAAFIAICHDNSISEFRPVFMIDAGIAAQTIMLSAASDGFGGCMIGSAAPDAIVQTLALDENLQPLLLLGLGKPEDNVVILEATDGDVRYFRDENNTHFVPKRPLDQIIVKR